MDEIEHTRQEAAELERQVRELQRIQAEVLPDLEAAEKAFWEDRLEEAEALFRSLPRLGLVTRLAQRIQALEEHLTAARRQAQIRQVRQTLSQARFDLGMAQTIQDVERIRQDLEDLTHKVDLFDLPPEEQARYDQIVEKVSRLRTDMEEGQNQEEKTQAHIERGEFQEAVQALEKALAVARDPAKRAELQSHLSKAQAAAQRKTAEFRQAGPQPGSRDRSVRPPEEWNGHDQATAEVSTNQPATM